jgi:stage V sporulation protein SpoVS
MATQPTVPARRPIPIPDENGRIAMRVTRDVAPKRPAWAILRSFVPTLPDVPPARVVECRMIGELAVAVAREAVELARGYAVEEGIPLVWSVTEEEREEEVESYYRPGETLVRTVTRLIIEAHAPNAVAQPLPPNVPPHTVAQPLMPHDGPR